MKDKSKESNDSGMFNLDSKFWKTFLTISAVVLIFAGPTYVTYVLSSLDISYLVSVFAGIVLLAIGIVLLLYLVQKKVIV